MPAKKKSVPPQRRTHHRTVIGRTQRARTEARIIAVAIGVFAKHGPFTPVIDDFVKAAGISRGTFYNYFPTTHALLEATVDVVSNEYISAIKLAVRDLKTPLHRYAIASRLYYRRAEMDTVFANFMSAVTHVGTLASEYARLDLRESIEQGLVEVQNEEAALTAAVGTMEFAVRHLTQHKGRRRIPGIEVTRMVMRAWGVDKALIDEALALPLPDIPYRAIG